MHMADALVSPAVGLTMAGISAAAVGVACYKMRKDPQSFEKLPMLAMAGAFVFAAQMINFTIPGTGSSGHIGGGLLLAALLGPFRALLTIAVVLLIQCLLFADGGVLAVGCNIFNMGIIPCLLVYPFAKRLMQRNLAVGTIAGILVALPLGAFAVVLETLVSGITQLPFGPFVQLMVPIHLAIAVGEGIATAAVLYFVAKSRPELLDLKFANLAEVQPLKLSKKAVIAIIGIAALCVGVGISGFASSLPDGLEWAILNLTGSTDLEAAGSVYDSAASLQSSTSIFPDYAIPDTSWNSGMLAAFVGVIVTAFVAGCIAWICSKRRMETAADPKV